jgi:hypothetical protein
MKSVTPDYLISLEDGKQYKSLKRHLAGKGLTPADYHAKWGSAAGLSDGGAELFRTAFAAGPRLRPRPGSQEAGGRKGSSGQEGPCSQGGLNAKKKAMVGRWPENNARALLSQPRLALHHCRARAAAFTRDRAAARFLCTLNPAARHAQLSKASPSGTLATVRFPSAYGLAPPLSTTFAPAPL